MPNGGSVNLPRTICVFRFWRRAARRAVRARLRAALLGRDPGLPSHVVETMVDMVAPPQGELAGRCGPGDVTVEDPDELQWPRLYTCHGSRCEQRDGLFDVD